MFFSKRAKRRSEIKDRNAKWRSRAAIFSLALRLFFRFTLDPLRKTGHTRTWGDEHRCDPLSIVSRTSSLLSKIDQRCRAVVSSYCFGWGCYNLIYQLYLGISRYMSYNFSQSFRYQSILQISYLSYWQKVKNCDQILGYLLNLIQTLFYFK